jgi:hypothetical protein
VLTRYINVIFAVTVFCVSTSQAQERPTLGLLIEDMDQDALKCGLNKSSIESISALTLRNNGVQVVKDLTRPYLYISTSAFPISGGSCALSLEVSILSINFLEDRHFKSRTGYFGTTLCKAPSSLMLWSTSTILNRVLDSVEKNIKVCLGSLNY